MTLEGARTYFVRGYFDVAVFINVFASIRRRTCVNMVRTMSAGPNTSNEYPVAHAMFSESNVQELTRDPCIDGVAISARWRQVFCNRNHKAQIA
jgi:hypothetical protein